MGFQANVLRVMIASPGDVADERTVVTEEIHRWNDANAFARKLVLLPVKWETHSTPQLGDHPQTIVNRQLLDEADIVVGIFGTRVGTPTEEYVSGTVEEIRKHVAAGKIAKVYFSDVPVPPSSLNFAQYASLQQFRNECPGLYATFGSIQQFRTDFGHHLDLELNQHRYRGPSLPERSTQTHESEKASAEGTINVAGPPDRQYLDIKSTQVLRLNRLDFLTSAGACISTQSLSEEGNEIEARLAQDKVVALYKSPRPDRNPSDFSGPAKLRLVFRIYDRPEEVILPVALESQLVQNTLWITLIGSQDFQLPA